jgi:hypothetical protein
MSRYCCPYKPSHHIRHRSLEVHRTFMAWSRKRNGAFLPPCSNAALWSVSGTHKVHGSTRTGYTYKYTTKQLLLNTRTVNLICETTSMHTPSSVTTGNNVLAVMLYWTVREMATDIIEYGTRLSGLCTLQFSITDHCLMQVLHSIST